MTGVVAPERRHPLWFAWFLALVTASGPMVTHALSALGPIIVDELDLSATSFGALWFVAFGTAALLTVPGGKLTDRAGPRPMLLGLFIASGLGLVAAGMGSAYLWLVLAAALSGAAQAIANPVTNLLVARSIPARQQGMALGIKQCGVQVSQFFVGLALPTLALRFGYDVGMLAFAAVAVGGVVLTIGLVPAVPRMPRAQRRTPHAPLDRGVWWLTLYGFGAGAINQTINVYLPLYSHQELGTPVARAGLFVALIGALGASARLVWGRLANRIVDPRVPLQWIMVGACVAMGAIAAGARLGEWLVWFAVVVFATTALAANVLVMLYVVRSVAPAAVGHASGWASSGLFAGFMVGPVVFGLFVDRIGGYVVAWLATAVAAAALVAFTAAWRQARPAVRA